MRAVVMTRPGGAEVLEERDLPEPRIERDDEVRIEVRAASVNPVDTKLRGRGLYLGEPPAILGCDGAGVVREVGPAVSRVKPGDAVYWCYGGLGQRVGNYAEVTVVPEACVARKPESLDFVHAAALPLVLITAWESLFDRAHLHEDQSVLVHGGAGGVGHVAIQLAKARGARVATTVSGPEKRAFVESLGADRPVDYQTEDVARVVRDWSVAGVDVALDTVGGQTFIDTFPLVRFYGDLVTLLQPPIETDFKAARLRNLRIGLELMLTPQLYDLREALAHHGEILERGAELADQGRLKPFVADTYPLARAAEAHRRLEAGHMTGKLVLIP